MYYSLHLYAICFKRHVNRFMAHIDGNVGGIRETDKGRTNGDNSLDADDTDNADFFLNPCHPRHPRLKDYM